MLFQFKPRSAVTKIATQKALLIQLTCQNKLTIKISVVTIFQQYQHTLHADMIDQPYSAIVNRILTRGEIKLKLENLNGS